MLDGVRISGAGQTVSTDKNGAASLVAVTETAPVLSVSRAVPTDETTLTNSAVNLQDAIAILKMIVGLEVNGGGKALSPYQSLAADFDGNGAVQLTDAIGVLKHVVGLSAPDPVWQFLNDADLSGPGKVGLTPGAPAATITANVAQGGSSPAHVGLVGYLSGDVDGSFTGLASALDLDAGQPTYFQDLQSATQLSLAQFGM